ncbi:FUSC family protein [Pseudomonas aeruginosa]|uniref:FUSC family protein n=1 Tax=Pseudomonas aeruginosa TaxID=287 RepID=UPI00298FD987|nr:FUSC family protein [Pseudomonas aeruginosa]WPD44485.1 FUSC family protein [Pseudomonas aeruginosa]
MKSLLAHYFQPNLRSILFALKGLSAVALALVVSMSLDLDKPFWAMVASMMLQARPETGLVIEKALCLILGSALGAAVAVFILDNFMPYPTLAIGALALCIACTSALASTERHVNFVFGLALVSVTAVLIVMFAIVEPATTTSESIFLVVRARLTEVIVGASCATLSSLFLFPWRVEALVKGHAKRLRGLSMSYIDMLLQPEPDRAGLHQQRLSMIALTTTISDDSNAGRYERANTIRAALHMANSALTVIACGQTIEQLISQNKDVWEGLLAEYKTGQGMADSNLELLAALSKRPYEIHLADLGAALQELTRASVIMGVADEALNKDENFHELGPRLKRHRDWRIAGKSALRNAIVFLVVAYIWILSDGASTLIMMMVLPTLFSQMFGAAPAPAMIVRKLIVGVALAIPVATFLVLGTVAQGPDHFAALILILAGPLFLALMAMTSPALTPYGLGFCLALAVSTQPSNYMTFAVDQAVTTGIGVIAGLAVLFIAFALTGPPKGNALQRRVIKALTADLNFMMATAEPAAWFNRRVAERLSYLHAYAPATAEGRELTEQGLALLEKGHRLARNLPAPIRRQEGAGSE